MGLTAFNAARRARAEAVPEVEVPEVEPAAEEAPGADVEPQATAPRKKKAAAE